MRTFLLNQKKPVCKWGLIPPNTRFIGKIPKGYSLAVNPSENYIVIDVDKHGDLDGFKNIPKHLFYELYDTFKYNTKNNGVHYWFKYSGNKALGNKTSGLGIDLRTNKGYVVWYLKEDVINCLHLVKDTSIVLNKWLEKLFSYVEDK
jgi:hypothetical protein